MSGGAKKLVHRPRRSAAQRAVDADRWTAARRAGASVDAIAAQAGVGGATVSRATSPFGPFPSPTPIRHTETGYVSVTQVAAELAVGRHVIYDLIRRGELPATADATGGHQIERAGFERWLARQYRATREWVNDNPGNFHTKPPQK